MSQSTYELRKESKDVPEVKEALYLELCPQNSSYRKLPAHYKERENEI